MRGGPVCGAAQFTFPGSYDAGNLERDPKYSLCDNEFLFTLSVGASVGASALDVTYEKIERQTMSHRKTIYSKKHSP